MSVTQKTTKTLTVTVATVIEVLANKYGLTIPKLSETNVELIDRDGTGAKLIFTWAASDERIYPAAQPAHRDTDRD